jgi:predicted CoA-binding protein
MSDKSTENPSVQEMKQILGYKTVAVIGASRDPSKPANEVPLYLKRKGYRIIPVNPSADNILGEKSYKSIDEVPGPVDIVDVFRPSEEIPNFIEGIIKKKPKVLWLQLGIHNPEAEDKVRKAGITVVYDRCMKIEHSKLFT